MHIYVFSPELLQWNFLQIPQVSIQSGHAKLQTSLSIFRLFTIFDCNFVKNVVPPSNRNKNCLVHLKGQSLLKQGMMKESKSTYKQRHNSCSKYITVEGTARWNRSVTNKKHKHHIFAPTAGARCSISPNFAW